MAAFVDRVAVHVAAGNGGHGVSSVHREKFKPLGGPDGGNGGDGGDIVLEVDPSVHTLLDFHHRPHQKAGNGKPGRGQQPPRRQGRGQGAARARRHRRQHPRRPGHRRPRRRRHPRRARQGRQGRARQRRAGQRPPQGPRLRPARRAGRGLRRGHRAQEHRRRRPGRLPVGGQVLADRGDVRGPARRSPTTRSPRWCPTSA